MKEIAFVVAVVVVAIALACSSCEGVSGTVVSESGTVTVTPDGQVEIIVKPQK